MEEKSFVTTSLFMALEVLLYNTNFFFLREKVTEVVK